MNDKQKIHESTLNVESSGQQMLDQIRSLEKISEETVIYGLYDNSQAGLWVRFNDFLIDRSKVTVKDKSYFFHMLAVMVDAGISMYQALAALVNRTDNLRFRRILNTLRHEVEQGKTLSASMQRFDDVFDESEIGIVKSGEATGRLDQMLFKLSEKLDKRNDLNMKLWGAAIYPIVVFSVLVLVAVGMLVWIFPSLLALLAEGGVSGSALPLATRMLMYFQNALVNYWWLILLLAFGVYGIFVFYKGTEQGRYKLDYFWLKLPIFGPLVRKVYVLRFIDMMGMLIESGLPVIRALEITGNSMTNEIYKLNTKSLIEDVTTGQKISKNLKEVPFLFPPEVSQMLSVGEASASLSSVSEKISEQYGREIDNSLKKLSSIFEPVMILVVGLFVAMLALAIMAPIFNLSSTLS
ncbi:hypothetical protein GF354_03425 [Candidatus Peregrinibacteria bacterium]|nr:hypothetical protein [Candidatus Peregrinibacteria bacterium]